MDALVRSRGAKRRAFTTRYNAILPLFEAQPVNLEDITAQFALLKERMAELQNVNERIEELMDENDATTEDQIVDEQTTCEEYALKYEQVKARVSRLTASLRPVQQHPDVNATGMNHTFQESKRFKLPKMEVPKFSGNLKDWLTFWGRFKSIHEEESLKDEDKFEYLLQAMTEGTRAYEVVNGFPRSAENYPKAVHSLEQRFGKKELLVEVYVRELLNLVLAKTLKTSGNTSVADIYDKLQTRLQALDTLGVTTEMCAAMLYPLVESALPEDTLRAWQRHPTSVGIVESKDRLNALMKFLLTELETEQRIAMAADGFCLGKPSKDKSSKLGTEKTKKGPAESMNVATAAGLLTAKEPHTNGCIFCDGSHDSPDCVQAKQLTREEREKNTCFWCLQAGHISRKCRYSKKCPWCQRKHVLLMCPQLSKTPAIGKPSAQDTIITKEQSLASLSSEQSMANLSSEPEVFLQTLRVKLVNGGRERVVRAIIDNGSHRSYILERTAHDLAYPSEGTRMMSHALFGGGQTAPRVHQCCRLHLRNLDDSYACNFLAYQQDTICQNVDKIKKGPWLAELRDKSITLTDVGAGKEEIELLIGADVAGRLLTGQVFDLQCGATAIETRLGWTVMGKNLQNSSARTDPVLASLAMFAGEATVSELWRLDVLGIRDPVEQKSKDDHDRAVMQKLRDTVHVDQTGRYEVKLPWKETRTPLPNNRATAERRLESTYRKLTADNLLLEYEKIFDSWLAEGIIEEVPENEMQKPSHYLPHRHVVKEESTTKIRPVFDASASEKGYPSVNQCMETGPNTIELIPTALHNFRENRVGVIADIKQASLQISLHPEDRDSLRFLWRRVIEGIIVVYRHCRVVFGVTSSPFLLGAVVEIHLNREIDNSTTERIKEILHRLKRSFYVDNAVTSVRSLHEAREFKEIASASMARGKFDLRGWEFSGEVDDRIVAPVLGMLWNKALDTLKLTDSVLTQKVPTEITTRVILSITQKVFDPLGMASPTILVPKLLLQKLWNTNLDWDTEVGEDIRKEFLSWHQELPLLRELQINRWAYGDSEDSLSLHLFVDASKEAYAAVVFVRVESPEGIHVHFVEAKSRVAPKERATIPRLELLGATVGARLLNTITSRFNELNLTAYCWTDSTTVLAWIQRDNQWATFVLNRVKEIRRLTAAESWRHVPGELNPADLPSRGCNARQLVESQWLQGPSWLRMPEECWPDRKVEIDESLVSSELRKTPVKPKIPEDSPNDTALSNLSEKQSDTRPWYLHGESRYMPIVRRMAWILRFVSNCQRKKFAREQGELSVSNLKSAENRLMLLAQRESFVDERDQRLKGMSISKDGQGLLRLRSLIDNRNDTVSFRRPVILDSRHPFVVLMMEYYHEKLHPAPIDTLISNLRERVWIIQCRRAARSVTRRCVVCKRYNAKSIQPTPIALPKYRVQDARVFQVTGMDFAGPLFLKCGSKVWVCLFTCAVYRAVHLELVSALSTEKFLAAFQRFIARRGRPSKIYADNATNFHGARNQLKSVNWSKVKRECLVDKIEWHFNPPAAPWWGGWWERLIRTLKDLLRRILKRASLTYEETSTVLCDCEMVINSRPLTYLSEDPQQLAPLTPRMFLQDLEESEVPDIDAVDASSLNKRQKYQQMLRDQFRQRFRVEYLGQLHRKSINSTAVTEVKVGDLVFCGNDLQKRLN